MTVIEPLKQNDLSSDTAPAKPKGLGGLKWAARGVVSAWMLPLMQRAARAYVGGVQLDDAFSVARRFSDESIPSTVGLWNAADDSARKVADEYLATVERLADAGLDSYISIKPPALAFESDLANELGALAQARGIRVHCDSHGPEVADASCAMMEAMLHRLSAAQLSTTLPGRWARSLTDADWTVQRGFKVRVVKGQWPDPQDPQRDLRAGFLEVIDRLAGRSPHVAVASHDVPMAAEAIDRLRNAGTSCELELLFGLPITRSLAWARDNNVAVRIYVPYGEGYIPHAIDQLRRNPRFLLWIVKDLMTIRRRSAMP